MKYIVKFMPTNCWGCITEKTNSKEEAYRIYHKMKLEVDIRPGHLFILEINNKGEEKYLCNYKTGKEKDGLEIIKEIKGLMEQLISLYDLENIKAKQSEYDKLSTDILHGIEIIDFEKVDEDEVMRAVFQQQKVMLNVRRQYKYLMQDAREINKNLEETFHQVNTMERILKKNERYRNNDNKKEKQKYLEKIGMNIDEYFSENN